MLKLLLTAFCVAAPLAVVSAHTHHTEQNSNHKIVKSDQLKSWYDQNKDMIVLDARTKPYFDGTLLPSAKWVPSDADESQILSAAPNKEALVVVYCAGVGCPASGWLYDKLVSMGYTNVYEYHDGLKDWMKKGYPTTKQN